MPSMDYSSYVRRVHFRRTLFGYRPDEVNQHLDAVSGWFRLAGLDALLEERSREVLDQAEQRLAEARAEASTILADARQEAASLRTAAEEEARASIERARRDLALERRGMSRVGRPLGSRPSSAKELMGRMGDGEGSPPV